MPDPQPLSVPSDRFSAGRDFAGGPSIEECRRALEDILQSDTISGSRRVRDFLVYSGQAALDGREELDQFEIALQVLHRKGEFNPVEDASVRKLVSQTRQKLEEYYSVAGGGQAVEVFLPNRSYVLRFRYGKDRVKPVVEPEPAKAIEPVAALPAPVTESPAPPRTPSWYRPFAMGAAAASVPFLVFLAVQAFRQTAPSANGAATQGDFVIQTLRGDLRGKANDIQPGAVLVGPAIGAAEELSAAVQFEPTGPTQQAGIMLFQDPDNFVRMGWQFKLRNMVELGMERQGDYLEPSASYRFEPVLGRLNYSWFTLRRQGSLVQGFISSNGFDWQPAGHITGAALTSPLARAALYGFDGRTQNRSALARFKSVGVGLSFHNRPESDAELTALFPDWTAQAADPKAVTTRIAQGALEVGFRPEAANCSWELRKPAPSGDWTMSTVLDYMPVEGGSAGLVVVCERGKIYLSRRALSGGSLLLEQPWDEDIAVPDFPGWPLITLRVSFQNGRLTASFSRDGERFSGIPGGVAIERTGKPVSVGIFTSIPKWNATQNVSPARFYRIQQDLPALQPYR